MKGFTCISIIVFLLWFSSNVFAESIQGMFIRMNIEIQTSEVRLIRATVHSGELQKRKLSIEHRTDPFLLRVVSNKGGILFEDTLQDPRAIFFDEPDLTGRLHGGMIQNKNGIATIVIPFFNNSRSIDFFHRVLGPQDGNAIHSSRLEKLGSIRIEEMNASMRATKAVRAIDPVNIQKTGKPENRIDMVFLAEGYTAAQRASFLATVRKVVSSWKKLFPWSEYFRLLNIYAVPLVSVESGADRPGTNRNTALDAAYGCFDVPRLLCIDYDKAFAAAADSVPQFDFAIAVVNDPEFGGSGGPVSVFSTNNEAQQIFFHEIAHTYASLADEYDTPNPSPPVFTEELYPNVTQIRDRNTIKWKEWILPGTPVPTPTTLTDVIGIFQGAFFHPTDYVRPKADCLMRTLGVELDSVCAEAHILQAFERIIFIDTPTPADTNIVLSRNTSQQFKVKPAPVPSGRLQFEWFVDGVLQSSSKSNFNLAKNQLATGNHEVMVKVTDKTAHIKKGSSKTSDGFFHLECDDSVNY